MYISNTLSGQIIEINGKEIIDKKLELKHGNTIEVDENIQALVNYEFITYLSTKDEQQKSIEIKNRKDVLTVTIFLTHQCNFRCTYCYEDFKNEKLNKVQYKLIYNFIDKILSDKDIKMLRINLFGGEPLLEYKEMQNFLIQIKDFKMKGVDISVGITTNGFLLNKERYSWLADHHVTDYQITIDGFQETHNKNRALVNGRETWLTIIENLTDICNSYDTLTSNIIIRTNFSVDDLKNELNFLLYLKDVLKNKVTMHFESIKNWSGSANVDNFLTENEEREAILKVYRFCKENQILATYDNLLSEGFYACQHNLPNSYVFDANLNLIKCTVDLTNKKNKVGILGEDAFIEYNNYIDEWRSSETLCNDCVLSPQCLGVKCPVNYVTNSSFSCEREKKISFFEDLLNIKIERMIIDE